MDEEVNACANYFECKEYAEGGIEKCKKCFHYTNLRPLWAKDNLRRKRNEVIT